MRAPFSNSDDCGDDLFAAVGCMFVTSTKILWFYACSIYLGAFGRAPAVFFVETLFGSITAFGSTNCRRCRLDRCRLDAGVRMDRRQRLDLAQGGLQVRHDLVGFVL